MQQNNCNELHIQYDPQSGCVFIIAINTVYGQKGNGGTRMMDYPNIVEAIKDATKLVNVMTKKCVIIGKQYNGGYSGGKGVIMGDPEKQKTPDMLRRYGQFVESLGGRLQTGTDMNINLDDIKYMAETCKFIDGLETGLGDTAVPTAYGVYIAMKILSKHIYKTPDLKNKIIAVQGVGSVGSNLIGRLIKEKAKVIATDIDSKRLKLVSTKYKIGTVLPNKIYDVPCDIFSPNAVGGILNTQNIKRLKCKMIIGGANNPLADNLESVLKLKAKRIIYAPDYVVNIGGVFLSMCEVQGKNFEYLIKKTKEIITSKLTRFIEKSEKTKRTLYEVAEDFIRNELRKYEKNSL